MADGSMIAAERNLGGRPSGYSVDIAAEICARVATGRALRDVASDSDMPKSTAIYKWLGEHKEFANMYARAREERGDVIAHEILAIADGDTAPDDRRVKIDARKWFAGRLAPKLYGDRITHAGDDDAPIKHEVSLVSEIMSTIHGASRPLPAAAQQDHRGRASDNREPALEAEQPLPH